MLPQGPDLCIFQSTFHKDDQYQMSLHMVHLYIGKKYFLSIMLNKVYVNLRDFRTGSYMYVSLG